MRQPTVSLHDFDDATIEAIVAAATTDARGDEVTPPLSPGGEWTPERVDWLRTIHRESRSGLSGATGQATWAIVFEGAVVGAVRLKKVADPAILETGIWLTRGARGNGVASAALAAVAERAIAAGAQQLRADTTAANPKAQAVLLRLGFTLSAANSAGEIAALLDLTQPPPSPANIEPTDLP
jgi:RimJ/RimL family protein N-acetyltransferase